MSYCSSLLPLAVLGLVLGAVQPTTVVGRTPRPPGAGVERSLSGGSLRLRAGGLWDSFAALAELPLDQAQQHEAAAPVPGPSAVALPTPIAGLEPLRRIAAAALGCAESPLGRQPAGPCRGRAPPVA